MQYVYKRIKIPTQSTYNTVKTYISNSVIALSVFARYTNKSVTHANKRVSKRLTLFKYQEMFHDSTLNNVVECYTVNLLWESYLLGFAKEKKILIFSYLT